jgi:hypothetical protein
MEIQVHQKQDLIIVVQKQHPNPRVHNLLFSSNTPFKPKVVQNRTRYQRHNKHRNSVDR